MLKIFLTDIRKKSKENLKKCLGVENRDIKEENTTLRKKILH